MRRLDFITAVAIFVGTGCGGDRTHPAVQTATDQGPTGAQHSLVAVASLRSSRFFHAATLLQDGRVLVSGGDNCLHPTQFSSCQTTILDTTEIFLPSANTFVDGPRLLTPRYGHSATLLSDGKVFLAGGSDGNAMLASTEIYDPGTGNISAAATAPVGGGAFGRSFGLRLSDGRVLILQDVISNVTSVVAEIYDPATDSFVSAAQPGFVFYQLQTATLLPDDRAVLTGIINVCARYTGCVKHGAACVYDPVSSTFTGPWDMGAPRYESAAALVSTGGTNEVFLVGGLDSAPLRSTELFDATTGNVTPGPDMSVWRVGPAVNTLNDGSILVVGGAMTGGSCASDHVELWNPATNMFSVPSEVMIPGCRPKTTLLMDGSVLITGGMAHTGESLANSWMYR